MLCRGLVTRNQVGNRTEIRIRVKARAQVRIRLTILHTDSCFDPLPRPCSAWHWPLSCFISRHPNSALVTLTLTRATETQAQLHPQPRLGLVDSQANKVGQGCWSGLGLGPKCFLGLGFVQHSGRGQPLVHRQPSC